MKFSDPGQPMVSTAWCQRVRAPRVTSLEREKAARMLGDPSDMLTVSPASLSRVQG